MTQNTWDEKGNMTSTFTCGYGYIKWRNVNRDNSLPEQGDAYSSIDFPLFRSAEAYLIAAEAILRGANGTMDEALGYVNEIRERAYMSGKYAKDGVRSDVSGDIQMSDLNLDFILAERQRELATELVRRTDLIRFGLFSGNKYTWSWKGNVAEGTAIPDYMNVFPIPSSVIAAQPDFKQNPNY